ncbi:MAG: hypothetical protein PHI79_06230 [Sulfurovaceae bacterium]|nr:hypothetical protein [Sulfurovaceae bacterium]MDD5549175.1 hypothetical protein [Sulfurovaceae bacterium]
MKKALLLSVIASTMIMAGGDIAPVEPEVVAPAPVAESGWKFSGQGVLYYETNDDWNSNSRSFFDQESSRANAGIQLTATNDNLISGVGFGVQLNGIGTLGLEENVVSGVMQSADSNLNGGYVSQLYLTYGINNTSFKVGRQELPKALSPFAYSEDWNVFKNTFDAALVVNTDIPNTTFVGAWVRDANYNGYGANMNDFNKLNGNDGVWMLTAQNKSIENLILTGSLYYANDYANILWVDAGYDADIMNIGLQGGFIDPDASNRDNTLIFGAKIESKFNIVNASLAFSHINDGYTSMLNFGGRTSVLYTDMIADQSSNYRIDNNKYVIRANADVLGGNLEGAYGYTNFQNSRPAFKEFDLTYKASITENANIAINYFYKNDGCTYCADEAENAIRFIGRYNF